MRRFYDRENEIYLLRRFEEKARENAQMTCVYGRRRIGKTALLQRVFPNALYFFVTRKNEGLLCEEYISEIESKLKIPVFGSFKDFYSLFAYLMDLSKTRHFTIIIDEFQEFLNIAPSVYSDMQKVWDLNKDKSMLNLVLCGSVYSLMKRIFENSKEPLFSRATAKLHLKQFPVDTLKEILRDNYPRYTNEDLLAFYMVTGGVAKYCELLVQYKALSLNSIINEFFQENSLFLDEGKNLLIEEFGKDYVNYFSILTLIASSKTSRTEIESIMETQTGGFLDRLEHDYALIGKVRPVLSKPTGRIVKYNITDNFLQFWFRFVYKNAGAVEIRNFSYIKNIVKRDYKTYSGTILERYFKQKLASSGKYSLIGSYWEKGNQNEIDIVAVNDNEKYILIAEVKRQAAKINLNQLREKSTKLVSAFKDYKIEYRSLSIADM